MDKVCPNRFISRASSWWQAADYSTPILWVLLGPWGWNYSLLYWLAVRKTTSRFPNHRTLFDPIFNLSSSLFATFLSTSLPSVSSKVTTSSPWSLAPKNNFVFQTTNFLSFAEWFYCRLCDDNTPLGKNTKYRRKINNIYTLTWSRHRETLKEELRVDGVPNFFMRK